MRILFCKVSGMKYYKGACDADQPYNGGSYVAEHGYGHEEYNFLPIEMEGEDVLQCRGFFEPKTTRGARNTVHIERIDGCEAYKNEPMVEDVLVVWCATREEGDATVVGWYEHASVYRDLQEWTMIYSDGSEEGRFFNVSAKASDCVLLPRGERNRYVWSAPAARYTRTYGFGQAMVWYPTEPEAQPYLEKLLENIATYRGENWLHKSVADE